jgi:hypothetical protein
MKYALLVYAHTDRAESSDGVPVGTSFEDQVAGLGGRILHEVVLAAPDVATGVRTAGLIDGPLGGHRAATSVLVVCPDDLDVAIAIARAHPAAGGAGIEIRPVA